MNPEAPHVLQGLEGITEKRAHPTLRTFILSLSTVFSDVIQVDIADAPCFVHLLLERIRL